MPFRWDEAEEKKRKEANHNRPDPGDGLDNINLPPDDSEFVNREQMLEDFLSGLPGGGALSETGKENLTDFTIDDYPEAEMSDETGKKIEQLKTIAESIEKKGNVFNLNDLPYKPSKYKLDYRMALNREQFAAATTTSGPLLVIAGAGSGKTRVIVYRVSYLLENGTAPNQILLLTFTRKAAFEMKNRVQILLKDKNAGNITGGTFHSFASHVLKYYTNLLSLPANFTIIDTADAEDTVDFIRTQLRYHESAKAFPKKKRIFDIISSARNRNLSIPEIIEKDYSGLEKYARDIELLYQGYIRYKQISHLLDFDDLMEVLCDRLRDNKPFRQKLQQKYKYIMVDEFQDTNVVQKEIVDLLAEAHQNIMVVGDDSQSIYAFRGANYENILRFPETYPDCQVIKIEQNYRSTLPILNFSNDLIYHARIGYRKKLFTDKEGGGLPVVLKFMDQQAEAGFIVEKVLQLREKNVPLDQIAVLNRADWHNRYIQTELTKREIPYVVVGGFRFHERAHVKDMLAYLKIGVNPYDAIAWNRVLKLLPGIGKTTAGKIVQHVTRNGGVIDFSPFLSKAFRVNLEKLRDILLEADDETFSIAERLEKIKVYYATVLEARDPEFKSRLKDIEILVEMSGKYTKLDNFLADFALDPPATSMAGSFTPLVDESEEKPLVISTIHSAKGLEWHSVFIPHALDGMLPSNRAITVEDMEEERRLFYVACSRAREQLFITYPAHVASYNAYFTYPSRFLVEIGKDRYSREMEGK